MPKSSGLGDNLYVDGYDLSGDVGSIGSIAGGNSPLDSTTIDKSANERLGGKRDGSIEFTSFFNDLATTPFGEHTALKTLPTTDRVVSYFRGTTLGNQAASVIGKQIGYDPTRGEDGSLTFRVQAQANGYGLEWGTMLTAGKRTESTATNGTPVDFGANTLFGLQAYLHVFALTSGTATIKIQESSDNGADAYADVVGGAFTAVSSAPLSQRIETARGLTVERFLRVVTTGTFSGLTFAVMVVKNDTEVVF